MGRNLGVGLYGLGDVAPGDWFDTPALTVTAAMVEDFARTSGDHFEIHRSEQAALRHGFDGVVAHGLLVTALVDGLKQRAAPKLKVMAALGWSLRFTAPVLVGDTIQARVTVEAIKRSSKAERGVLSLAQRVSNQRNETVQDGVNQLMVYV